MKRFLAALRFLTVIPVPGTRGTGEAELAGSVPFFPVVGLLLGSAAAIAAWGLSLGAPPLVSSAVIVVVLLAFSGGLHIDGLADAADGLLSARPRERALEIMQDSHVGALGVVAIVGVLLVKFASLASLPPGSLWRAAFLMPVAGRCALVVEMALLPYVRPGGLGAVFFRKRPVGAAVGAVVVLVVASWAAVGAGGPSPAEGLRCTGGLIVAAACVAVTLALAAYFRHRLGGATGDTLGATCEIVEIVPALVLAVLPRVG
jgi:adenosylcobinamide-GDP ribazoletransferase